MNRFLTTKPNIPPRPPTQKGANTLLKKIIALSLIFALLAPVSPALAAGSEINTQSETAPSKLEEILNEYHRKSFQAQVTGISTCSTGKSLEEETVEALNNSGYEAYYVTGDNYEGLESTLQTDFSAMGLSKESSYIVTLSFDNPAQDKIEIDDGGLGGTSSYTYTYNGTAYKMRNITVTASTATELAQTSTKSINKSEYPKLLDVLLGVIADGMLVGSAMTFLDIVEASVPDGADTTYTNVVYTAGSSWTVIYYQVYESFSGDWISCASKEYVTLRHWVDFVYYDYTINTYDRHTIEDEIGVAFSPNYLDYDKLHKDGLASYLRGVPFQPDTVEEIKYTFNGNVVITHQRN